MCEGAVWIRQHGLGRGDRMAYVGSVASHNANSGLIQNITFTKFVHLQERRELRKPHRIVPLSRADVGNSEYHAAVRKWVDDVAIKKCCRGTISCQYFLVELPYLYIVNVLELSSAIIQHKLSLPFIRMKTLITAHTDDSCFDPFGVFSANTVLRQIHSFLSISTAGLVWKLGFVVDLLRKLSYCNGVPSSNPNQHILSTSLRLRKLSTFACIFPCQITYGIYTLLCMSTMNILRSDSTQRLGVVELFL